MKSFSVMVMGVLHPGKTTFAYQLNELAFFDREGGNIGRITVDDEMVMYLLDLPEHLSRKLLRDNEFKAAGVVIVVDSCKAAHLPLTYSIRLLAEDSKLPYVIAANKQDLSGALSSEEIRNLMGIPAEIPVLPCIANDRESVKAVLLALLKRMPQDEGIQKAISKLKAL